MVAHSAHRSASDGLRIAFIGSRGVPATYGGVEHHVEEIGRRLADRGHEVTVFCRPGYAPGPYDEDHLGMHRDGVRTLSTKHFDAIVHSMLSSLKARHGFDIVHYHALGPGLAAPIARYASRAKVVLTVHGLDAYRAKWGGVARTVLQRAEWMSARVPDSTVVVSHKLAHYYDETYARAVEVIRNGVDVPTPAAPGPVLDSLGLTPGRYVLFVGRLVPEKAPDALVRAFAGLPPDVRLVLVGDSSFTAEFVADLRRLTAGRNDVVLAGPRYGAELAEIYSNAGIFVLPSLLEGMPLTLLEALSHGLPVIASDIPAHLEVLRVDQPGRRLVPAGDVAALSAALVRGFENIDAERVAARAGRGAVLSEFSWDAAADAHEQLYRRLVGSPLSVPATV